MSGIFYRSIFALKVGFGVLWAIFAAEMFLRLLHPVPVVPRHVMAGPYGIRVNEPNKTYWHRSADFRIQIRTNDRGIRADEEIPYSKPAGVKRIVVLGDSFGMGYEVNLEDTFLARMEQELRVAGQNVQVVNLSVSGYGNAEELIALEMEGLKYHPDLVLLCWDETDYEDNVRSNLYAIEGGKVVRKNPTYLPGVTMQRRLNGLPGYNWVESHLDLYSFIREWVSFNVAKPLLVLLRDPLGQVHEDAAPDAASNDTRSRWTGYPTDLMIALLREIQRVCGTAGSKFAILDIPEHNENTAFHSSFPADPSGRSFGLDVISPVRVFEQNSGRELIFWKRSQGHLTPAGCKIVGHLVASEILTRGLLEAARADGR